MSSRTGASSSSSSSGRVGPVVAEVAEVAELTRTVEQLLADVKANPDDYAVQRALTNALRGRVSSGKRDWLNDYTDYNDEKNCPLPIDGDTCVSLLGKCLGSGDQADCRAEWSKLNFAGGFDTNKMDLATARNLVNKMGITDTVDEWVKTHSLTLQPTVAAALKAIVARVRSNSGLAGSRPIVTPMVPASSLVAFVVPQRVGFTPMTGLMVGGGGNRAAANFIQMSNYLKNSYTLVGGNPNAVPSSVAALRSSLAELEKALQSKSKQIDSDDKKRIVQLIDSLQRTEEKAELAAKYMSELRRIIAHPKFDVVSEIAGPDVTAAMMAELSKNKATLLAAASKKSFNLLSIFESIAAVADDSSITKKTVAGLVDDVKAIKAIAVAARSGSSSSSGAA